MNTIVIESATAEPAHVFVTALTDPTATPPDFQITAQDVTSPTGSWVAGSWVGSWSATRVTAQTQTIGATGQLVAAEGTRFTLWIRWGTVVKKACTVVSN